MEVIEWSPFMKIRSLNAEVRDNIRFGLEFEKSAFGKYNVDNAVNAGFRYSFWLRINMKEIGVIGWSPSMKIRKCQICRKNMSSDRNAVKKGVSHSPPENARAVNCIKAPVYTIQKVTCESEAGCWLRITVKEIGE